MNVIPRISAYTCPACGGHIGDAASIDVVMEAITSPSQRIIFDALSRAVGRSIRRDALMDLLYSARPDGGPETQDSVIKVQVCLLRKKIEPYGWTITTSKGGSGYLAQWRLIPTVKGA